MPLAPVPAPRTAPLPLQGPEPGLGPVPVPSTSMVSWRRNVGITRLLENAQRRRDAVEHCDDAAVACGECSDEDADGDGEYGP